MNPFGADVTETLTVFWDGQPHTRADLQRHTGRARNTLTKHLDLLARHGLLATAGKDEVAQGRPGLRYRLRGEAGVLAVVQVGDRRTRLTIADLLGRVHGRCAVRTDLLAPGLTRAAAEFLPGATLITVLLTDDCAHPIDPAALAADLHAPVHHRTWSELAATAAGPGRLLCVDTGPVVRVAAVHDGRTQAGPRPDPAPGLGTVIEQAGTDPRSQYLAGRHLGHTLQPACRQHGPDAVLLTGPAVQHRAFVDGVGAELTTEVRVADADLDLLIARGGCAQARVITGARDQLDRVLHSVHREAAALAV